MSVPGLTQVAAPQSLARSIGWSALAQGWNVALAFASAIVIARLLSPSDYAVLAIVAPVIGVAHNLQSLGFGTAIVQARTITREQLDTLFAMSLAVALALVVLIALTAPFVAAFARDPRVGPVLMVASGSLIVLALAGQPAALLTRAQRFKAIALRNMISSTIGSLAAVVVAFATRSYWALAIGLLAIPTANFVLSTGLSGWRPRLPRRGAEAGQLVRFGSSLWASNLLNFASRNADNLIVAHFASARELGLYDRSYRVLFYPLGQAVLPLGHVLIPVLSRSIDDPGRYREYYWRAIMLLQLGCLPGLALCVVHPATTFGLLLGDAWLDGAPLFQWFAAAGLFQIYLSTTSWLFISQGRGKELMQAGLVASLVALASFLIGIGWGILGVAQAYVIGQLLLAAPATLWMAGRSGPVDRRDLVRGLLPHAIAVAVVLALLWGLRQALGSPLWPRLLLTGIAAYLTYAAVLVALPASRMLALGMADRLLRALRRELGEPA